MRRTWIIGIALALMLLVGCGGGSKGPRAVGQKNGFGDPYISQAQAQSVQIGESPTAVFQALGGKANSGILGANPVHCYDYPLAAPARGQMEFCFRDGKLISKGNPRF